MRKNRSDVKKLMDGESPKLAIWLLFIVGILILTIIPVLITLPAIFHFWDFSQTGQIGDTIGGITAPFIALVGALLTFLAFWIQVKANKVQTKQFKAQDISNKKERFETKFYDMIKLHRENVSELNIQGVALGRDCFVEMFNELRFCYCHLAKLKDSNFHARKLSKEQLYNIAYLTFFFGIGFRENIAYKELMSKFNEFFIFNYNDTLSKIQSNWVKNQPITIAHEIEGKKCTLAIKYIPFDGHAAILGHYFRHLFQTAKFIIDQDDEIVPDKYEYIKTLRAQLSTHEQLLLYYNSLSILGEPWNDNKLLSDYRIVKNILLPYADFYIQPNDMFGQQNIKGANIFEWDEILERLNKLS